MYLLTSASVIVEGILMIAAIVTASIFASTFLTKLLEIRDAVNVMAHQYSSRIKTELTIIYTTYLSNRECFAIYSMNIGKSVIYIKRLSIYFGNSTLMNLYTYDFDGTPNPGEWYYEELGNNVDDLWEPGETIVIYVVNQTSVKPPYVVKLALPNGYSISEAFVPLINS